MFGVTASPFLLNAILRQLHSATYTELVSQVLRSIYVDDLVTGSRSENQAYKLCNEAKSLLKTGAFKLRKFLTYSKRDVVNLIGHFYDPLGFLVPVVVKFKIFMQSLYEARIGWDETLLRSLMSQWSNLVADLAEAQPLSIP